MQVTALQTWHSITVLRTHRRAAEAQITARVRASVLASCVVCWQLEVVVASWVKGQQRRLAARILCTWDAWGKRQRRVARLAGCAAARRLQVRVEMLWC